MSLKEKNEAMFFDMMTNKVGEAIERQEARGQSNLCKTQYLSTKMKCSSGSVNKDAKEVLAAWGVEVGEPVEGDKMFTECKLPEGWEIKSTDHSMWNKLVDDKGRKRGLMFYKAAFYDRSTHLDLDCRYNLGSIYETDAQNMATLCVRDADDTVLFKSKEYPYPEINADKEVLHNLPREESLDVYNKVEKARENARKECEQWLEKNYPDWKDEKSYWN